MPSWISRLTDLEPTGSARFTTPVTLGSDGRLFGGLIAAQALAAAGATVGHDRIPQSLHAYFVRGGRVGVDVDYAVDVIRDGRSFDTRRVTASQEGAPIFEMLTSFHRPEPTLDWQRPAQPGLELQRATQAVTPPESWADYFETRVSPSSSTDWPLQPFWFRSREQVDNEPLLQACALTFVSDLGLVSTARPPGQHQPGPGGAASLDHALWMHRPIDVNGWHCYDATPVSHNDARGLAFGSVHDHSGRLVASVAQESLWRVQS